MNDETRPVRTFLGPDGVPVARTVTTPGSDKVRARCAAPPSTVIPVVFIPGIMGSNLRNTETKESSWNCNTKWKLALQWAFRWSSTRQTWLNPKKNEVDPTENFPGPSATVPDKETAIKRGWDTCSDDFYGDFLRWLDNQLNADMTEDAVSGQSPWHHMVDNTELGQSWGAQKAFDAITEDASIDAWNDFFCPVHAIGYNWLKSNGEAAKDIAAGIQKIIESWDQHKHKGHKPYTCKQVILVSHSMGGLTSRAAAHDAFGGASASILGIVHGEQPANGAAAAYHHCRSGYDGLPGLILGRNAAQVTAVFANAPGAMELLPNQQYTLADGTKQWLRVQIGDQHNSPLMRLPESDPYTEIYNQQKRWWRLIDPSLIDPANDHKSAAWSDYGKTMKKVAVFHHKLNTYYHSSTFIHYGADAEEFPAYGELSWQAIDSRFLGLMHTTAKDIEIKQGDLKDAISVSGSNPVVAKSPETGKEAQFNIIEPDALDIPQPGDGTVPACSGEAPIKQGGSAVKQGFRLAGFEHSAAYNDRNARQATLYSICQLLKEAKAHA